MLDVFPDRIFIGNRVMGYLDFVYVLSRRLSADVDCIFVCNAKEWLEGVFE
jgi:hypothetical protein